MTNHEPTSAEFIGTQPDKVEQYATNNGYREGQLFTEKGKQVDIGRIFKPGEVALVQENKEGDEQPAVYILLKGVAISVQDSLKQEGGGILFKELNPLEDSQITLGSEPSFSQGGTVDRVLLSSTRYCGGEPIDPQQDPVAYFAEALIKHRRTGRGYDSEDYRTKSGQAMIALENYL